MQTIETLKKIKNDFEFAAENLFRIRDKSGEDVPLKINIAQKRLLAIYKKQQEENKPVRIIVLKARQMGISTITEALIFHRETFATNRNAAIIAHEKDASNNLFSMFKRYYFLLPKELRPTVKHSNEKKIEYGRLRSIIKVYTAEGGENVGRSATIQDLHISEVAFWRNARSSMTAIMQTVPDKPNTMVIIESTANGVGDWFYDTWMASKEGKNEFVPLFLAWHEFPEYSRPFESEKEKELFVLNEYESQIQKDFNLKLEQINWYRYTLNNKLFGDTDMMKQEYPSYDMEAFIQSGRPVFPIDICLVNYNKAKDLHWGMITEKGKLKAGRLKNSYYRMDYFNMPEINKKERNRFAAGVDVAEGLEGGDYSVIKILDRKTWKVVMTYHGHTDPDVFARELLRVQNFFNGDIWFEIEKNNHGLHVIIEAFKLGVHIKSSEDFKRGYTHTSHEGLGFTTTSRSKPLVIDKLNEWIREGLFEDDEKEFWQETLTFVHDDRGRLTAQEGAHDDRIIAMALAINCSLWMPPISVETEPEPIRIKEDAEVEDVAILF